MAFFGSKSYERDLKRTYSIDRIKREREHVNAIRSTSISHAQGHPHKARPLPGASNTDEFGVIIDTSKNASDPPSLTFSSTTTSTSLPPDPASPEMSASLSVPVRSGRSSSSSSLSKQPPSRTRTTSSSGSGGGSKHSSHSSTPSRRRTPQLGNDVSGRPSTDAVRRSRTSSATNVSRRGEAVVRSRSSLELTVERNVPKSRSRTSLRPQTADNVTLSNTNIETSKPVRPPRSVRLSDAKAESNPSKVASPSASLTKKSNHSPASHSISSSSSSPRSLSNKISPPIHQRTSPPESSSTSMNRRDNPSLAIPAKSNPNSVFKNSTTCGHTSDSSYGTPFPSEFGMGGFNVKRLLSKPAIAGSSGVRSEPDTSVSSYGSNGSYGMAARKRLVDGRSRAPETPTSLYSVTGANASVSMSVRDRPRKPATSDPEPLRSGHGSLGRARGLEWGHVLDYEREHEKEKEREKLKTHARDGSSFSLSSPSESIPGYPYGRALEREQERKTSKGTRPLIQLTTNAVKRLSTLGAREVVMGHERERERSQSPAATFALAPSHASGTLSATPSPLTGTSSRSRNAQPSPVLSVNASISRRTESPLPSGLTPAEIILHTYKEQERRRAELEREATRDAEIPKKIHSDRDLSDSDREKSQRTLRVRNKDNKNPEKERFKSLFRHSSSSAVSPTTTSHSNNNNGDRSPLGEPPTPYYTVFGEPSGRTVTIGSARDSAFGLFDRTNERRARATEQAVVAELSKSTKATVATGLSRSSSAMPAFREPVDTGTSSEEKTGAPRTLRRKLSRKMSAKFRHDGTFSRGGLVGGRDSGKDSSDGREGKDEFGDLFSGLENGYGYATEGRLRGDRPSLTLNTTSSYGRRSATLPREKNAPVKMSLDSFVAVQSTESVTGRTLPSAANGMVRDAGARPRPKDEKDKNKLWGLVKRISSGTLKDKYKRCSAEVVPPVPTLPHDVSTNRSPKFDAEKDKEAPLAEKANDNMIGLGRRPTLSRGGRPSTAPTLSAAELGKEGRFGTLRKKPSLGQVQEHAQLQPQFNGRFSARNSPVLSDGSSPRHSDGSEPTGVNERLVLGEHILPPEALYKFDDLDLDFAMSKGDDAKTKTESRYTRSTITDDLFYGEEPPSHQALPVPPRRPPQAKPEADEDESESPTIPSFSADNAINTFGHRNRDRTNTSASAVSAFSGVDFGPSKPASSRSPSSSLKTPSSPPPRPPRSTRRGPAPPSIVQASSASQNSRSSSPSVVRTVFDDRTGRTSISEHSQASTARPSVLRSSPCSTPSPPPELLDSQSPVSASDSASSTMTFRDMNGTAGKPLWSEQEKMEKWNDLLDRSEKAGGTLHVGVGGLLSDRMRDSALEPIRDSMYDDF